jgi:single-strand DNA-binding protein
MNRATLYGNVGKDPEIRHTQDGKPIANFSLATSDRWKDKTTGEKKEKTEWHRVVCFNEHISKTIEQYVKKGSKLIVEGAIRTRQWTDKDGIERYSTEIVIEQFNGAIHLAGDSKSTRPGFSDDEDAYGKTSTREAGPSDDTRAAGETKKYVRDLDDEVPF